MKKNTHDFLMILNKADFLKSTGYVDLSFLSKVTSNYDLEFFT